MTVRSMFACPGPLHEDFCGVEPVTHPPVIPETRPPPPADLAADLDFHRTDEAILASTDYIRGFTVPIHNSYI